MVRIYLGATILLASSIAVPHGAMAEPSAHTALKIRSSSITLPMGDRVFPGGAQAQAINDNCLTCHSAGMVLNQPALTKATWEAEVTKMMKVYKAPLNQKDIPAIIAYLTSTKGAN